MNKKGNCALCALNELLEHIKTWDEMYPLDLFPEPDLKRAAEVLKENGMTLDLISASNMRHVLKSLLKSYEELCEE